MCGFEREREKDEDRGKEFWSVENVFVFYHNVRSFFEAKARRRREEEFGTLSVFF